MEEVDLVECEGTLKYTKERREGAST